MCYIDDVIGGTQCVLLYETYASQWSIFLIVKALERYLLGTAVYSLSVYMIYLHIVALQVG